MSKDSIEAPEPDAEAEVAENQEEEKASDTEVSSDKKTLSQIAEESPEVFWHPGRVL